jgi:hypothetical protein
MFCSVPLLTDWNVPYELARKVTKLDSTRAVQWETYPGLGGFALEVNILTDSEYLYPYKQITLFNYLSKARKVRGTFLSCILAISYRVLLVG